MHTPGTLEVTSADAPKRRAEATDNGGIDGTKGGTNKMVAALIGAEMQETPSLADALTPDHAPAQQAVAPSTEASASPNDTVDSGTRDPVAQPPVSAESVGEGAVVAGVGTGAMLSMLPTYGGFVAGQGLMGTMTGTLSLAAAGAALGIPAATGVAGYWMGRKLKHPVAGAAIGAAAGAGGVLTAAPMVGALQTGATLGQAAVLGALGSVATAGSLAVSGGVTAGVGAALYGLGRWHGNVWQSKPGGILTTMARGILSPVSVPWGYMRNKRIPETAFSHTESRPMHDAETPTESLTLAARH